MIRTTITALLSALLLLPGTLPAAETAGDKLQIERSRQDSIYHSTGEQRPEGYVIDRTLTSYKAILPQEFAQTLSAMGPKDRWLDIGAGRGQAVLDYFTSGMDPGLNARAVAMSIEDRRTPEWHKAVASVGNDRMQYIFGKRLSEYAPQELAQFRIITDVIGGFSYTDRLSVFMERVLSLLEPGGGFYTVLQDVHSAEGSNKPYYAGAPYLTVISNPAGAPVKVCDWLKSISCVEVTCELKTAWKPPIEVYGIRKVCNEVRVPSLTATHYEAGTPPERGFRLAQ
ncbi:MAG: hypothetical protein ACREUW_21885 [Burkholderiales bacterium]